MRGGNVLVTGGTGFLGNELIRRFCRDTDEHLWVLSRASKGGSAADRILGRLDPSFHQRITILEGELSQPSLGLEGTGNPSATALFEQLLDSCDEVFHNGADLSFRSDSETRDRIMNTNVGGTARLLDLARRFRRPLRAFNFTSTAYVHGTWDAGRVFREEDQPTEWRNAYEHSKWRAESLVVESGLPFRVFRPSIIVTEPEAEILSHDGMYTIGAVIAKGRDLYRRRFPDGELSLEIMADAESAQNFVLRRDVVDMFMRLRSTPGTINRHFHTVSSRNTRLEHMFDAMAHTLGFSYTFVDEVTTRNPVSHLFRRTVLPAYEGYLFNACPALDQANVRAALGDAYVDDTVSTITAQWMTSLFHDYFLRCGVAEGTPPARVPPAQEREAVAALVVNGWGKVARVQLLGACHTSSGRSHLWRVRTSAG